MGIKSLYKKFKYIKRKVIKIVPNGIQNFLPFEIVSLSYDRKYLLIRGVNYLLICQASNPKQ